MRGEPRTAAVFRSVGIGVATIATNGVFLDVNDAYARMLGYEPDELIGRRSSEFTHPDDVEASREIHWRLASGDITAATVEKRYRHRDGHDVWARLTCSFVADKRGNYIIGAVSDITDDRTEATERDLLVDIVSTLAEADDFERALTAVLRRFCEGSGWALAQLWLPTADGLLLNTSDAWYGADPAMHVLREASVARAFTSGEGIVGEAWETRKLVWRATSSPTGFLRQKAASAAGVQTAVAIPLLAGRVPVGVVEFFSADHRDKADADARLVAGVAAQIGAVVVRRRDEQALRDSEQRLRTLTELAPVAVVTCDSAGRIVGWNQASVELFGVSKAQAVGRPITALMPERYRSDHHVVFAHAVEHGMSADRRAVEIMARRGDGVEFPAELSLSSWMSEGQKYFTAILRDMSEQHAAQEAVRLYSERLGGLVDVLNEVLRASSSVAAVSQLVVDRAHMLLECDSAVLTVEGTKGTEVAAASGMYADAWLALDPQHDPVGHHIEKVGPTACDDTANQAAFDDERRAALGIASFLSVPLTRDTVAVGALRVMHGTPRAWSDSDIRTLQLLATGIGTAMESARAHEDTLAGRSVSE